MRWLLICMILVGCSSSPTEPKEAEMKKAIITAVIVLSSLGSAGAQTVTTQIEGTQRLYTRVRFTAKVDTVPLFTIPANCELRSLAIACDTAGSTGTDSIKIGIQGEDLPLYDSFRFGSITVSDLTAGDVANLSHYQTRQFAKGGMYVYDGSVTVVCSDAETYYPVTCLFKSPGGNIDTSGSGSAFVIPKYFDGDYNVDFEIGFSGSKVAEAHSELFHNTDEYDYISMPRSIGAGGSVGSKAARGRIELVANDSISIHMESGSISTTYTIEHMQFNAEKISDFVPYRTGATEKVIQLYTPTATGTYRFYVEYTQIYP